MKIVRQFRTALGALACCAGVNAYAAFFVSRSTPIQIGASFLGVCIMVYLFVLTYQRLERPFAMINQFARRVAEGDLTVEMCYVRDDELGAVVRNYGKMLASLNTMLMTIIESANSIVNTVDVLMNRSQKSALSAQSQSSQSHQIAAAAEEMSQTITDIAKNASAASETSAAALETAHRGYEVAENSGATVHRVYNATVALSGTVEKLNSRVEEISGIAAVIKGIADQTNLLALNAAIEAARAGEQGRGFAVVADEVRKLAERTIKATGEINDKIASVQTESRQTMQSMDNTTGEVIQATSEIKKVGAALSSIVESVRKARDQVTQIAAAVEEQSATTSEVATNVEQTATTAREMETLSRDVSHDVDGLIAVVEAIRSAAETFVIKDMDLIIIDRARTDHLLFMDKINSHLRGDTQIDPAHLPDHHSCRFGKWYDSDAKIRCGSSPSYKAIEQPHARIHAMAKEAVVAHASGDAQKAGRIYDEMKGHSAQIAAHLSEMKKECAGAA